MGLYRENKWKTTIFTFGCTLASKHTLAAPVELFVGFIFALSLQPTLAASRQSSVLQCNPKPLDKKGSKPTEIG